MGNVSGINNNNSNNYHGQIASGKRLMRAADGAAELAIAKKEESQVRGYDAGTRNAEDGKSLLNVSDAALSGIGDNLLRIRELAVKASNTAVLSDDDRRMVQDEIEQLKKGISDIANNTQFNTKNLLDGSSPDIYIAAGSDGSGMSLNIGDATLEALGIADFDVTGSFSINTIDSALGKVSENRSVIGAQSTALDYTIGYNTHTAYNLTSAMSRLEDTDIEKTAMELQKKEVMQTYRLMVQKKQAEEEQRRLTTFFM